MNFYLGDSTETAEGQATNHIKREGYERLRKKIKLQLQSDWSVSTTKLSHQPGTGGTTLAMQVLWDLRKKLRCAVLIDPSCDKCVTGKTVQKDPLLDTRTIAKQVIQLFKEGDHPTTVLLLQDNEHMRYFLQDCIIREIAEQKINANIPVVIILKCERMIFISDDHDDVTLHSELSAKEKGYFAAKEKHIQSHHREEPGSFHSFDIIRHNFDRSHVESKMHSNDGKEIIGYLKRNKSSHRTKLFAFIALICSYVPGSYLLQSVCESFHKHLCADDQGLSFEEIIQPFREFIVTFSKQGGKNKCVRIAHPVLAHQCVELLADIGDKRSTATLKFLKYLCRKQIQPSLLQFFKDLLTKRERTADGQERFSRLILDIDNNEDIGSCIFVLKNASETFKYDPFYPQSLARFYYSRTTDFGKAEEWALKAKERVPTNSFIADTLAQVHKNHLNKAVKKLKEKDILTIAGKAINAFKQEEDLAEREVNNMLDENITKVFNNRGLFGYLQVARIVHDSLTNLHPTWEDILTHAISSPQLTVLLKDRNLLNYKSVITDLKDGVHTKCEFFDSYFTYSDPMNSENEPPYLRPEIMDCYSKYTSLSSKKDVGPLHRLKEKRASTFPGLFSILNHNAKQSNLNEITELWKKVFQGKPADEDVACNYILANIILSNEAEGVPLTDLKTILQRFMDEEMAKHHTPEFYLLVLLLFWPENVQGQNNINLNKYVGPMRQSFEKKYKIYLQFRELVPLFYLGRGAGLNKLIHKSKLNHIREQLKTSQTGKQSNDGDMLKQTSIQDLLLRVQGVSRDHKTFVCVAGQEIEVCPHKQASVSRPGVISFFLGFNISGLMAFDIKYSTKLQSKPVLPATSHKNDTVVSGNSQICHTCDLVKDSNHWTKVHPVLMKEAEVRIHCHWNQRGQYECIASGLRWVCKSDVTLQYHYCNWNTYSPFLEPMQYIQGGPLLDITIKSGQLEEIHLPHFVCLSSDPSFKSEMRILHVEKSGISIEKVDEATCCHAKLLQPSFSPKGVIFRFGKYKVHCELMIYLSGHILRTYLFPSDPSLVEAVEKQEEKEKNSKRILVPRPEKSLKIKSWFSLENTCNAHVTPERIQLRSSNTTPSFFMIRLENLITDIGLELKHEMEVVWKANIHKDYLFMQGERDVSYNHQGPNNSSSRVCEETLC
ncbi:sterile alpha motif domain-containing protein 9-like [Osmerus eperlanus]|uniref:sterile alpha motif domain-containing protein 9-like n=1 Tax=Osmerus eperlanus TaxID=29151 RepID=UPI002E13EDCA